jgi:hypothetical protein
VAASTAWIAFGLAGPNGPRVVLSTFAAAAVLFGFGRCLLVSKACDGTTRELLALPAGLIAFSGLAQGAHHLGLSVWLAIAVALGSAPAGLFFAWRRLRAPCTHGRRGRAPVAYGWLYLAAIVLVGLADYSRKGMCDAIAPAGGGMHWIYPDMATHEAFARLLAAGPQAASAALPAQPLVYHYGRHVMAYAESLALGLPINDAMSRSCHMLGLFGLVASAIALGRAAAPREERSLAGALAIFLVMLLPSLYLIVANLGDSCSRTPQVIFDVARIKTELGLGTSDVVFGHFSDGGSYLWAAVVALTVATLLATRETDAAAAPGALPLAALAVALLLSILGMALNAVASLACTLVVSLLALLQSAALWRRAVFLLVAAALFRGFQHASGLMSPTTVAGGGLVLRDIVASMARLTAAAFVVLLCLRSWSILVFTWGDRQVRTVLALFVFVLAGLYAALWLQEYSVGILAILMSAYAAAPAARIMHSLRQGGAAWEETCVAAARCWKTYAGIMGLAALLLLPAAWFPVVRKHSLDAAYGFTIILPLAVAGNLAIFLIAGSIASRKWLPSRRAAVSFFAIFTLICVLGLIRADLSAAFDVCGESVLIDAGRVESLKFLRDTTSPHAMVAATFTAEAPQIPWREKSFGYAALCGRYLPLEGWQTGYSLPQKELDILKQVKRTLATTRNPAEAREIVARYGITHILLEPGQSLGFAIAEAPWLTRVEAPGSMGILAVHLDNQAAGTVYSWSAENDVRKPENK